MKNSVTKLVRVLSLLLVLAVFAVLFTACKKQSDTPVETMEDTTATIEVSATDEWGQKYYDDVVPESLNYKGAKVNILMRGDVGNEDARHYEWLTDTLDGGDALSQAIWFRNLEIEEELNVELNFITRDRDAMDQMIINSALGDGDGIDIISHYHYYATSLSNLACYKNFVNKDFTYLHLENPYWNQNFINYAEWNDRLFVLQGDMNISTYMTTFVMFFQKNLLRDMCDMESSELYEKVLDGGWTIDELITLCTDTATLDSVDGYSDGDVYAFTSHYEVHAYDGLLAAFDIDLTTTDENGNHKLLGSTAQRKLQAAADKLVNFYRSDDVYLVGRNDKNYTQPVAAFKLNRSVFCSAGLGDYKHLSEMETDSWGLLPMPKYDEKQENYYAGVQDSHNTVAAMYGGTKDYEMISAVLELFASKSYSSVRPTLFNRVLKGQKLQDVQSTKVFDIIMDSTRWDFADIYPKAVKDVRNSLWRDALRNAVYGDGDGAAAVIGALAVNKTLMNQAYAELDAWLTDNG